MLLTPSHWGQSFRWWWKSSSEIRWSGEPDVIWRNLSGAGDWRDDVTYNNLTRSHNWWDTKMITHHFITYLTLLNLRLQTLTFLQPARDTGGGIQSGQWGGMEILLLDESSWPQYLSILSNKRVADSFGSSSDISGTIMKGKIPPNFE